MSWRGAYREIGATAFSGKDTMMKTSVKNQSKMYQTNYYPLWLAIDVQICIRFRSDHACRNIMNQGLTSFPLSLFGEPH